MTWIPLTMQGGVTNPKMIAQRNQFGMGADETKREEVWSNDLYEVIATHHTLDPLGLIHLSIKRYDRSPVRNWRHLQQIKNEVVGPESEAFEIFPAESKLVDTANQYHLWCIPRKDDAIVDIESDEPKPGAAVLIIPVDEENRYLLIGYNQRLVSSDEQTERYNEGSARGVHRGKQEPWEKGLTTGGDRNENPNPQLDKLMDHHDED